ncbi:MAG: tagaturonate epimerase family protein [Verrucomicrobiae bacterium]|nr:tagaturonate epimerase family protein [Verrucomicrobiae bacterium]
MKIEKFSMGVGDRFGRQAKAQLCALSMACEQGSVVVPVWNKSNREHTLIGTKPAQTRQSADAAVKAAGWKHSYYLDADHINLKNVDGFLAACDFFTLDVADFIGMAPAEQDLRQFVDAQQGLAGTVKVKGIDQPLQISKSQLESIGRKYLTAVKEAAKTYRHIEKAKGADCFVTEVSMDESEHPQTPVELLVILAALAKEGVPAQTIAPKFTGRFNKGVDYVGDVKQFAKEFEEDLAVLAHAVSEFKLPSSLKLSVHSGSDKFSLYPIMRSAMKKFDAGVHLKTAGTTWLEEVVGLAMAGGDGLKLAAEIYELAYGRREELSKPYATVIDINPAKLPAPAEVKGWSSVQFVAALQHNQKCPGFNPHLRQLVHVSFKIAAEMGKRYDDALQKHEAVIARNVTENLFDRHIRPLFLG